MQARFFLDPSSTVGGVVMNSQSRRFTSKLAKQGLEQNLKHWQRQKNRISDDPKRKLVPRGLLFCNRLIRMNPSIAKFWPSFFWKFDEVRKSQNKKAEYKSQGENVASSTEGRSWAGRAEFRLGLHEADGDGDDSDKLWEFE